MQEFPAFQEVYNKRQGEFELISVAVDERANPRDIVSQNGYNWVFALSETATQAYTFSAIPTTLFIDSAGNVVEQHTGGMSATEFEMRLSKIL